MMNLYPKIYIVAGNRDEFDSYVERKREEAISQNDIFYSQKYCYVGSEIVLRGLTECHGYFIGSYASRKDLQAIRDQILIINSRSKIYGKHITGVWVDEIPTTFDV